ncbi:MAG: YdcF family protein [Phaeodactylibacter sp.]|uniref:YdcF family protein n=1 Tax=Phaeodactylibacter sp. TaxID=1940289 RepID=UPI0032EFEE1C
MFFILSKLLVFLLKPITWVAGLLFMSWFSAHPGRKRKYVMFALVVLLLFSNGFIFNMVISAWEPQTLTADQIESPYAVGILLGGYSNLNIRPVHDRHNLNERANRFINAFELYKKGKIRKLLLTGGQGSLTKRNPAEASEVVHFLETLGVPRRDILVEDQSRNTYENAAFSKALIEEQGIDGPFLLLTSAWHMPRSAACFEKAGLEVTPFAVDYLTEEWSPSPEQLILPNARTFYLWELLLKEWVGILAYRLKGYN